MLVESVDAEPVDTAAWFYIYIHITTLCTYRLLIVYEAHFYIYDLQFKEATGGFYGGEE